MGLVNANIVDGKFDEAEKGIKELKEPYGLSDPPPMVEFLEAQLAVAKGDWTAAKATLADVLPKLQDDPRSRGSPICILANATNVNRATSKNRSSPIRRP